MYCPLRSCMSCARSRLRDSGASSVAESMRGLAVVGLFARVVDEELVASDVLLAHQQRPAATEAAVVVAEFGSSQGHRDGALV